MKCRYSYEDIEKLLEGALPIESLDELREHMVTCKKCCLYYEALGHMNKFTLDMPVLNCGFHNKIINNIDKNRYIDRKYFLKHIIYTLFSRVKPVYIFTAFLIITTALVFNIKNINVYEGINSWVNNENSFEVYGGIATDNGYVITKEPIFTDEDISYYEWKEHRVVFKDEFIEELSKYKDYSTNGSSLLGTGSRDKFIIFVNGKPIYEGFYKQSSFSSFLAVGALMVDIQDGVRIDFKDVINSEIRDKRSDPRIYKVLSSKGLIR